MISIKNTLDLVARKTTEFSHAHNYLVRIALIGGQAVISHGVPRVTMDIDICVLVTTTGGDYVPSRDFADFLNKNLGRFKVRFTKAAADPTDPLKHDFIRLLDKKREYPVIDILFARYLWEKEGMENPVRMKGLPLPVLPMPYLVAMKLKAGGPKDHSDILDMFELMSREEKRKSFELAQTIHCLGRLKQLIKAKSR